MWTLNAQNTAQAKQFWKYRPPTYRLFLSVVGFCLTNVEYLVLKDQPVSLSLSTMHPWVRLSKLAITQAFYLNKQLKGHTNMSHFLELSIVIESLILPRTQSLIHFQLLFAEYAVQNLIYAPFLYGIRARTYLFLSGSAQQASAFQYLKCLLVLASLLALITFFFLIERLDHIFRKALLQIFDCSGATCRVRPLERSSPHVEPQVNTWEMIQTFSKLMEIGINSYGGFSPLIVVQIPRGTVSQQAEPFQKMLQLSSTSGLIMVHVTSSTYREPTLRPSLLGPTCLQTNNCRHKCWVSALWWETAAMCEELMRLGT